MVLYVLAPHNRAPVIIVGVGQKERNRKRDREGEKSLKSFTALGGLSLYMVKEKSFLFSLFFFSNVLFFPPFSVKGIVLPVINVLLTA